MSAAGGGSAGALCAEGLKFNPAMGTTRKWTHAKGRVQKVYVCWKFMLSAISKDKKRKELTGAEK